MRICFASIGSLGDLYPCLALGVELKRRGHVVGVASTGAYRDRVEPLGLHFHTLRPNWNPADPDLIRRCEDLRSGPEVLIRDLVLPHLADTYADLLAAMSRYDVLLAGELVYAAPLVAEKLGCKWASIILSSSSFLSAHDPSLLVNLPQLIWLRHAGWRVNRAALDLCTFSIRSWWEPVKELRAREGLRPSCAPLTRDKFSPWLVLAMFSAALGAPQPDWPSNTVQTGFAFHDEGRQADGLERFLSSGEPPIVFTQGSTAVAHPGSFFETSEQAALRLGKPALLLGAPETGARSDQVFRTAYAPYAQVFPRAAAIVHQGGSGTTGQALRAGKPMLLVPFGWDQPDNALRVKRLGAGLILAREEYRVHKAVAALDRLLRELRFARRASEVAEQVRAQDGIGQACDAIEGAMIGR